MWTMKHCLYRK